MFTNRPCRDGQSPHFAASNLGSKAIKMVYSEDNTAGQNGSRQSMSTKPIQLRFSLDDG